MKQFLKNIILCGIMFVAVLVLTLCIRVIMSQEKLLRVFSFPKGTQVLCIGNSHTGCTWFEAPEFKNYVLWSSHSGFGAHYMRFREFERRGKLDTGVKYCILDCDYHSMGGFSVHTLKSQFVRYLPFSWRYISYLPANKVDIIIHTLCHATSQFYCICEEPPELVPDWTTRTKSEQESYIKNQYGVHLSDWESEYTEGWQNTLLWMISDIKKRCDAHGIQLILFAGPLTSANPIRNNSQIWERESNMIEQIRALGIEYYDFRLKCDDNKFRDADHLLRDASYKFTEEFFQNELKIK